MKKLNIVGVMGSGRTLNDEQGEPLGRALAALPVHLLTGGGYGVMTSVAKGFTAVAERQGLSIGCIPMKLAEDGQLYETTSPSYPNPYIEMPIYTPLGVFDKNDPDKVNRNFVNVLTSDIVIALPGGVGTKQEIDLAVRFKKAVMMYGTAEQFSHIEHDIPRSETLDDVICWVAQELGLER